MLTAQVVGARRGANSAGNADRRSRRATQPGSTIPSTLFRAAAAAILLVPTVGCAGRHPSSMHFERTSVLWMTVCTLRADHLGAYGYEFDVSPNLDRLAQRGVLFERALAPAPWTRASIAATVTGLYPRVLNIEEPSPRDNDRKLHSSFRTLAEVLHDRDYYTIGITANPNTDSVFGFEQGYDHYEDTEGMLWRHGYKKHKHAARQVNASLLECLRGIDRGRKFFAHLVYVDVHKPYVEEALAEDPAAKALDLSGSRTEPYDRQIRYLDSAIAELLAELEALGYRDLLVVITGDHGEAFGLVRPRDRGHGRELYNETIWVPFILYHPALESLAHRHSSLVEATSVMPTVVELLGIDEAPPAGGAQSLAGMILGRTDQGSPQYSAVETCWETVDKSALVGSGWKLIENYKRSRTGEREQKVHSRQLFQYEADWDEQRDLSAERPDLVEQMSEMLRQWQQAHAPQVTPEEVKIVVDDKVKEALKALGYLN